MYQGLAPYESSGIKTSRFLLAIKNPSNKHATCQVSTFYPLFRQ